MNKSSLIILGAGGHSKVVAEIAAGTGEWQRMAFLDDKYPQLVALLSWPVLGKLDDIEQYKTSYESAFVAIGGSVLRHKWMQRLEELGVGLATLVHPSAVISPSAILGAGTVVMPQSVVNADTSLGEGVILNTAASVGHDCVIGDYSHMSAGVRLAGGVKFGWGVWAGMGASVIGGVTIGDGAIIGAGAVVLEDVAAGVTVVGVPAHVTNRASH